MSMISSQRDTLFVIADALEEEYPSFAREVRRAADTIWELRNKLAGVVDQSEEIKRLKEQVRWLREMLSESRQANEHIFTELKRYKNVMRTRPIAMNALFDENAELREQIHWLKKGDVLHVLTDQELADQQKHEREMRVSIDALEDENAELRQERDHWHVEQVHAYGNWEDAYKHASELESENAKLRKQVTQLQDDWESERDYADQMEAKEKMAVAENAELRKLARGLNWCTENAKVPSAECERCPLGDTEDGELSCEKLMRELGIEVDA